MTRTDNARSAGAPASRGLIKHSLIYMIGDLLTRAGAFVLIPIYTRTLSSAEYGMVAIASLVATAVSSVAGLSLAAAVLKLGSEGETTEEAAASAAALVLFVLVWSVGCGAFGALLGPMLLGAIAPGAAEPKLIRIAVATGCLTGVVSVLLAILQRNHKPVRYRLVTAVAFTGNVTTGLFMVVQLGWGAFGAVLAQMIGAAAGCATALGATRMTIRGPVQPSAVRVGLRTGIPLTLYAAGGIATDQLSRLFVERYVSLAALGIYNIGYLYCTVLAVICGAINTAWVPRFFQHAPMPGSIAFSAFYGTVFLISATSIGGILSILARDVLWLAVATEYRGASGLVPLLMINALLSSAVWTIVMNPLVLKDRTWWVTGCALISGLCNVALNLVLTARFGVIGAVFSSMGALLVLNGTAAIVSLRAYRIPYRYGRIAAALACAAGLYGLSRVGDGWAAGWSVAWRGVMAATCAGCALLLLPRRQSVSS